jgi:hypothetical protein
VCVCVCVLFLSDSFSVLCGDILSTFALLLLPLLSKHACFINSRHNSYEYMLRKWPVYREACKTLTVTMHNHVTSPVSYETKGGLSLLKMEHILRGFWDRVLDVFTLYLKMYPALCNYKTEGRT